jgi:DNA-binding NtrC family response regulator
MHSFSLVIDPRQAVRSGLVQHLDAAGERAIAVATPLDAVQLLLEHGEDVQTVFIGPERPGTPSYELVEFLSRNYPRVRRVLMGDAEQVAGSWKAQQRGEVHALLEMPCESDTVRQLVTRISASPH